MIRLNDIPKKNPDIAWRVIEKEVVALNLKEHSEDEASLNIFNDTGTIIWKLIDGKNSTGDIVKKITSAYAIEPFEAESEILRFLHDLCKKRLVSLK